MTQENQEAERSQPSQDQVVAQIDAFRQQIIQLAVEDSLSFDVVFNALSQVASEFAFHSLLLSDGELTQESVTSTVTRFNGQTLSVALVGLENMRELAEAQNSQT